MKANFSNVRFLLPFALLLSAADAPGCAPTSVIGGNAACDFREGSVNGPEARCQEYENSVAAETFKATCTSIKGKAIDGLCPREGVLGGCILGTQGDGSQPIDWYYKKAPSQPGYADGIATADDVKKICEKDKTTFKSP